MTSRAEFLADIATTMGGRAAEEVIFGTSEVTAGASADIEMVTRTARNMIVHYGMSSLGQFALQADGDCSEEIAAKIDIEIRNLVEAGRRKAVEIITEHRHLVDVLTDLLLDKETIEGEEFRQIIDRETGRKEVVAAKPVLAS
jgi:cell division protease FtsH